MRKIVGLFCCVALLGLAGFANAATIFKNDEVKYSIGFDWQIQLRQEPGTDEHLDVEYDDLEFQNTLEYKLSDKLTAIGKLDFGFIYAADSEVNKVNGKTSDYPHLEEAWLGFKYDSVTLAMGKAETAIFRFGEEQAIETCVKNDAFWAWGSVRANDMIFVDAKNVADIVSFRASYELASKNELSDSNGKGYDVWMGVKLPAGFSVGGAYQSYTPQYKDEIKLWGVEGAWSYKNKFRIGADYSVADDLGDVTNIAVSGTPIKKVNLAAGYVIQGFDADGKDDIRGWYANASYKALKKVTYFVEVMGNDGKNVDMGYMSGIRMQF